MALLLFSTALASLSLASDRYTDKQLDALAERVGRTFWVVAVNNRTPAFLSVAAPNAPTFNAKADESFEITELVGRKAKNPYYKVKFASGKEGYILPETFHEELNLTILTVDVKAEERQKAAAAAEEDKKRVEWIRAQPWSEAVKQAAIQRRPVPGLNTAEAQKILGAPTRITKVRAQQRLGVAAEEHWFYPDGSVLVFQNGLLARVETKKKKN